MYTLGMELQIYTALIRAGVAQADAKAVVESISQVIDKRYSLHAAKLFNKSDGAALKSEMMNARRGVIKAIDESQRWTIVVIFALVGIWVALSKVL